ncbi:MAG: hypothetical protein DBX39_04875 [Bacillota bacterium]|nr:MAG: hypothetical protein DBX39_04875 [Bacillota bacterium]
MLHMIYSQTMRNLKIFLKDKANIFFALLSPLIVLGLYILFLGRIQTDGLLSALQEMGVSGGEKEIRSFADCWMLSGVMASACITVPLCACGVMVQDRNRGIRADLAASPVPGWMPPAAYFFSVVAAGLIIGFAVLVICLVWLAATGSWFLSVADVLVLLGTLVMSVLSSSTLLVFVVGFLRTEGAFTGLNVILGTVIGFLIGAYMPLSVFPTGVQYVTLFVPGSYSAGIFRNCFMNGALDNIAQNISPEFADALASQYALKLNFFGTDMPAWVMAIVLGATVLLFAVANLLAAKFRKKV